MKGLAVRFVCTKMLTGFRKVCVSAFIALALCSPLRTVSAATASNAPSYSHWKNGPPADANFFPIAVWLQDPRNAERYKAAGINVYVGLWRGPDSNQLATLEKAGMRLICSQTRGLEYKDNPIIIGWMHGDEPDNAQSLGTGKGYGPPISPEEIIADYKRIHDADPTRPVLLNLGQGVAWDNYIGRGVRRNHPEDYAEYVRGCDIASFDIYPVVHEKPEVAGKLQFVAKGVERLREWTYGEKFVWNCIECTRISNVEKKATPEQVRAEVWMSLIHGSRGLIYFVHQFKPVFREAALFDDAEMLKAVTAINREVQELAPMLNSATLTNGLAIQSLSKEVPIAAMFKRHENASYIFAVAMRGQATRGVFKVESVKLNSIAEVIGESRNVPLREGEFSDDFPAYGVHLYRIQSKRL